MNMLNYCYLISIMTFLRQLLKVLKIVTYTRYWDGLKGPFSGGKVNGKCDMGKKGRVSENSTNTEEQSGQFIRDERQLYECKFHFNPLHLENQ